MASPWMDMAPLDGMKSIVRKIVSKKKRRFKQHGFNLDLSYITPRIIAMGFPSEGVQKELMIQLNLVAMLNGYPSRTIIPLLQKRCFISVNYNWLVAESNNVIIVHCKAGKGRTGLMVCAYLLYSRECSDPVTAIQYYGEKRTKNGKGVTISSQRRYLFYFYDLWKHGPRNMVPLVISKISLYSNISLKYDIQICIACNGGNGSFKLNPILESDHAGVVTHLIREGKYITFFLSEVRISGDVKITVHDARSSKKPLFYFWFNTAFVDGKLFSLTSRSELDKASKSLDDDTKVHVYFSSRLLQKVEKEDNATIESELKTIEQLSKQLSAMNKVSESMLK